MQAIQAIVIKKERDSVTVHTNRKSVRLIEMS